MTTKHVVSAPLSRSAFRLEICGKSLQPVRINPSAQKLVVIRQLNISCRLWEEENFRKDLFGANAVICSMRSSENMASPKTRQK